MNRFAMSLVTGMAALTGMNVTADNAQASDFRFGLNIRIGEGDRCRPIDPGYCRPVPAPVMVRVWVPDVYETRCREVWVPEVCETRFREVMVPAVTRMECVSYVDHCGRVVTTHRPVVVVPARCERVPERFVVSPGHFERVEERVLVCAGHWEMRRA